MRLALILALAALLAGCASPQRFQSPPQAQIITPQQPRAGQQKDLHGPYTREREDREFGR
jgi:PBP1b-binding outer membrane lipoprotein LpoB